MKMRSFNHREGRRSFASSSLTAIRILFSIAMVYSIIPSSVVALSKSSDTILEMTAKSDGVFGIGKPVFVTIIVENISKAIVLLPETCYEVDYRFTITDVAGKSPALTEKGRKMNTDIGRSLCSRKNVKLQPGKSKQVVINASAIFDMTRKGRYTIFVTKSFRPIDGEMTKVHSNPVTVIIE